MRSIMILFVAAHLLMPALAQADVILPEFAACIDKKEGDACIVTEGLTPLDGTCQMDKQCRINYSCDASTPCGSTCSDALKCKSAKKDAGNSPTKTDVGNLPVKLDVGNLPAKKDAGNSTVKTDDDDSGSCAVPSRSLPLSSGIFFLIGLLLVWRLRRS